MSVAFTREESAETAAPLRRKENGRNYLPQRWTNYRCGTAPEAYSVRV
jgi:hypothetical protein